MGRHRHVVNVRADGIAVVLGPLLRDVRIVAAALVAVGVEFGLRRAHDEEPGPARAGTERDLGRHRLSGRLA